MYAFAQTSSGVDEGIFVGSFLAIFVVIAVLGLALFALWVYCLIHLLTNETKDKVLWLLVLLFVGQLGAVVYFFTERKAIEERKARGETVDTGQPQMPPQQPPKTG